MRNFRSVQGGSQGKSKVRRFCVVSQRPCLCLDIPLRYVMKATDFEFLPHHMFGGVVSTVRIARIMSPTISLDSSSQGALSGKLVLQDGTVIRGQSFGARLSVAGEVVFNTGMVGYPETLTDPSYRGQILTLTYPLIGNYGVPHFGPTSSLQQFFESGKIQVQALLVSEYSEHYSHWTAKQSLGEWLRANNIPALSGIDTRTLTRKLREKGTMLGKIVFPGDEIDFYDPDMENMVAQASIPEAIRYQAGGGRKRVVVVDCGCKHNILHQLLQRNLELLRVPWDFPFGEIPMDGLFLSNGPGNPKMCKQTVIQIRKKLSQRTPIFGICMGHQLMALAAGANTYKLKFGHRGQNQPVQEVGTPRCLVTSQNHSFAVATETIPEDWEPWFVNLNDGSNEGIRHKHLPFFSVQFHPEATPGPVDANFLFDRFVQAIHEA